MTLGISVLVLAAEAEGAGLSGSPPIPLRVPHHHCGATRLANWGLSRIVWCGLTVNSMNSTLGQFIPIGIYYDKS